MATGFATEIALADQFFLPEGRMALRPDTEGWLPSTAAAVAIVLHLSVIVVLLENWLGTTTPPIEPPIVAELVIETPEPSAQSEPAPAAAEPLRSAMRQSGGDETLAPGGAEPAPETIASAPPEPKAEAIEGPQPNVEAAPPPTPTPSEAKDKSPERPATKSDFASFFASEGQGGGDRYMNSILAIILEQPSYPLRQGGTAHYEIMLDRVGNLISAKLIRTSGIGTLDDAGLMMIRRAAPFPPVPKDLGGERIVVSVRLPLGPQGGR